MTIARPASDPARPPVPLCTESQRQAKGPPKWMKSGHTLKAQTAGLSTVDYRASKAALKKLTSNKHAKLFLQPVDPIRDHASDYFTIIQHPMDLYTIMGSKLEQGMYKDRFEFQADFRLMIDNAKQYNMPNSFNGLSLTRHWISMRVTMLKQPFPKTHRNLAYFLPFLFSPPPCKSQAQPSSSAPPIRPTIKLKDTSQQSPPPTEVATGSSKPSKPRVIKSKLVDPVPITPTIKSSSPIEPDVDAPLPPYIDDGSLDRLQEVLAIEREKDEVKRQRSLLKSQESAMNGFSSKRKHDESSAEDDILALATPGPAMREKPTHSASTSSLYNGKLVLLATKSKQKKDVSAAYAGKEKEIPVPPTPITTAPLPKIKKQLTVQATPINKKKCKDILKTLNKIPDSVIFQVPVDPVRDCRPIYFDEIKLPMDFGTISTKLGRGEHSSLEDFRKDMELMSLHQHRHPYLVHCLAPEAAPNLPTMS
ncbi:Bromodomain-containing protein [Lentinula raphanica]|nr:Bromodomain-containing protein [Lentinula raphanica]